MNKPEEIARLSGRYSLAIKRLFTGEARCSFLQKSFNTFGTIRAVNSPLLNHRFKRDRLRKIQLRCLILCWAAMPEPKLVIAVGACAISGSPFEGSAALDRDFLERFKPALYVPGCPPHPLTILCGILDLLGIPS